jgi:hypothetical protein
MTRELVEATRAGLEVAIKLKIAAIDERFRPSFAIVDENGWRLFRAMLLEQRGQAVLAETIELRAAYARFADPIE